VAGGGLGGYPDDLFNGLEMVVRTGVNAGQRRTVLDFDGTTRHALIDRPFDAPMAAGDAFDLTALPFPSPDGSFDLRVTNESTGAVTTFNIEVDLDKSCRFQRLDAGDDRRGGSPRRRELRDGDGDGRGPLQIKANSPGSRFNFANDTSGFLAPPGSTRSSAGATP